jgi:hypothetical protein
MLGQIEADKAGVYVYTFKFMSRRPLRKLPGVLLFTGLSCCTIHE